MAADGAVIPGALPLGRLERDAEWGAVLREAWAADAQIGALPQRGAELASEPLEYEHDGVRLHGWLAYDSTASSPRPGVLVLHTAAGPRDLYLLWRAAALASQGYVALVADLYGDRDGQGWEVEFARPRMEALKADRRLLQARTRAGLTALRAHARADGARCAALGYCLGGRAALDLARAGDAELRAAVSFHGILDALPPEALGERVHARVLVCDGALDPFNSHEARSACCAQLGALGADWEMQAFGRARHGFTCPAQRLNAAEAFDYEPMAAKRSWASALAFLADSLSAHVPHVELLEAQQTAVAS